MIYATKHALVKWNNKSGNLLFLDLCLLLCAIYVKKWESNVLFVIVQIRLQRSICKLLLLNEKKNIIPFYEFILYVT